MRASALAGAAAAATALAVVLSGCGSDTKTASSSSLSTASSSKSSSTSATKTKKVEPPEAPPTGNNPTIASYIQENAIKESLVKQGDPGAPTIDLPVPDGWEPAGDQTPDDAYGAIIYTGPDAGDPPPRIIALFGKLTGDVDPQKILDLAPGELNNLPGYEPRNEGATSTLGEYPAYQLGGGYKAQGVPQVIAQKTVVIPAADGLYVLQLNAYATEAQADILGAATDLIDQKTTITP